MTMINMRKYVEDLGLGSGDYHRANCPVCGGKNTFTAINESGVLKYNCYKLDCKVSGVHHTNMTAAEIKKAMQEYQRPAHKEKETMEIPVYVVKPTSEHTKFHRFVRRYGIASGNLMYDVKDERVVFPIYYKGSIVDAVGRAVGVKKHPKWYRYTGKADYFTMGSGQVLLILEDVVSAIVAYQEFPHITSMAILGTQLTDKHIQKIGEYNRVVIALDPDAASKTLSYSREIREWTGIDTYAFRLHDDVKYRVEEDMERLRDILS